jgi:PPM family protein phosphatase
MEPVHNPPVRPDERRRRLSPPLSIEAIQPLSATTEVEFGAYSRSGDQSGNEDQFLILRLSREQEVVATSLQSADLPARFEEYGYAMVVADGGGQQGSGALASRVALSTLAHLAIYYGNWNLRVDTDTADTIIERAEWFYRRAAHAVERYREAHPTFAGMGTTLTAAFSAGDDLFFAHVGHSRAYLFREGALTQLTRDHTLDQQLTQTSGPVAVPAGTQDLRQALTHVIGAGSGPPAVDVERIRLHDNDTILLCTHGLTSMLDDDAIAEIVASRRRLEEQCRELVDLAVRRGTLDATALLANYHIPPPTV